MNGFGYFIVSSLYFSRFSSCRLGRPFNCRVWLKSGMFLVLPLCSRTCCVGDGTTRVLQRGQCLVLPPSTLDPVHPAGVLETLPPGILVVCSSWSMVKFVSQYSLYLPGSQVMFILSMFVSVDTASNLSSLPFSNYRNVRKISKFIWLLEPLQFPFQWWLGGSWGTMSCSTVVQTLSISMATGRCSSLSVMSVSSYKLKTFKVVSDKHPVQT